MIITHDVLDLTSLTPLVMKHVGLASGSSHSNEMFLVHDRFDTCIELYFVFNLHFYNWKSLQRSQSSFLRYFENYENLHVIVFARITIRNNPLV